MFKSIVLPCAASCLLMLGTSCLLAVEQQRSVSFRRDIQPLLARRCFVCHGPSEQRGGLALHLRHAATAPTDSGNYAIVAGHPDDSQLLSRVLSHDEQFRMPLEGPALSADEIGKLREWIVQGAEYTQHWAFVVPQREPLPVTGPAAIDLYVGRRLRAAGFQTSPRAESHTLVRRLAIDLLGLLPTPEQVDRFVQDPSDDVYEELVDQMLQSKHFGERWGRHWLDLARYADTFGYERDDVRPNAWRYRDWVIHSINTNQPYNDFLTEQLAGDLLTDATVEQQVATGLHRMNTKNNESGINKEDYHNRETVDRVNTTATAMLGLTIGCAQCHDHKYDPISQKEFYQLYSFFDNVAENDFDIEGTNEEQTRYQQAQSALEARREQLKTRRAVLEEMKEHVTAATWRLSLNNDAQVLTDKLQALEISESQRNSLECARTEQTAGQRRQVDAFWETLAALHDDTGKALAQLSVQTRHLPKPYVMALHEKEEERRETFFLVRGDFKQKGERVGSRTPGALSLFRPRSEAPDRLDLARWITSRDNPLAARVAANHFWRHLFGAGLVSTPDDFGIQGEPPSHPGLLDWLAVELMESGWDRKHLVKTIVMSNTYRQSSFHREDIQQIDPENRLLSRQSRFRVEAEIVRDLFLAAPGLLHRQVGGPTIYPFVPAATEDLAYKYKTQWIVSDNPNCYRRGMYIHFKRTNPYPSLMMFDAPESNVCLAQRNRSNTPLQALVTLNDPVFVECAQALGRDLAISDGTPEERIQVAAARCLLRTFVAREVRVLLSLLQSQRIWYGDHPAEADHLVAGYAADEVANTETAAWLAVARAVLNLDEFVTRE
ncbi:MAG: hypothetical protein CMJ81_22135 [Planctomycetaceae bacterium]|nr:hypothetical protein [Planctomycetaceae bacterium]